MLLAVYPSFKGNEEMSTLVASYPEVFREMFQLDDFTSGAGFMRTELFSLMGPLLLIIAGVLWGSDAVAGEEERGTLDLLLANPISRRRVVLEKWGAVVAAVALVSGALGLTLLIGGPLAELDIAWTRIAAPTVASFLLAALFATLSLAVGAATGHRGLARGSAAAAVIASYLVSSLSVLVSWLEPLRVLSPWYHALGVDPIGSGLAPFRVLVLVLATMVFGAVAMVGFERRDLAV